MTCARKTFSGFCRVFWHVFKVFNLFLPYWASNKYLAGLIGPANDPCSAKIISNQGWFLGGGSAHVRFCVGHFWWQLVIIGQKNMFRLIIQKEKNWYNLSHIVLFCLNWSYFVSFRQFLQIWQNAMRCTKLLAITNWLKVTT